MIPAISLGLFAFAVLLTRSWLNGPAPQPEDPELDPPASHVETIPIIDFPGIGAIPDPAFRMRGRG